VSASNRPGGRLRPGGLRPFWRQNTAVVRALRRAPGLVWDQGFSDHPLGIGTLTWWADAPSATRFAYAAGTHQQAVRGMRAGGWARETWFGRFTIADARGTWHGTSLPVGAAAPR
jgi:hypothetical protein